MHKQAIVIIIQLTTSMVLLDWLLHLLNIPQEDEQMKQQAVIALTRRALLKIDAEYFIELSDDSRFGDSQDQEFLQIFTQITTYLTEKNFKKLTSHFEKEILSHRNTQQLIALVLYIAVNSPIRKEVIEQILDTDAEQQCSIMKTIQIIESQCQQITELKKIVEKIENIQQENEALRVKIAISQEELNQQLEQIQQIQIWNATISNENIKYEEEKQTAYKELDITRLQEFIQICNTNRQQSVETANSLQVAEGEREILSKENIKLKKQHKNCGETIQRQIKEIEDLKIKCKNLSQQYWLTDYTTLTETTEVPPLPLNDRTNRLNVETGADKEKKKLPTDRTECSNMPQELEQSFEIKNNLHVLLSLQDLQRQEQEKKHLIIQLKQQRLFQLAKQKKLEKRIKKIREAHKYFMDLYEETTIIKL